MPPRTETRLRHGALLLDPATTRFALWAPDAKTVAVEFEDGSHQVMPPSEDHAGWYVLETACTAETPYRFRIDDEVSVPDPASRIQAEAGDVHGFGLVVDPQRYQWLNGDWNGRPWHEAAIYELHVGVLGGYAAVEKLLPRIADAGFTAIELMPLAQFPGDRNWGYDGVLPYAPQCSYGSPEDLKQLIDTAHAQGLAVILDVVYNHFGPDGNYLGRYAKGFFREDKHTPWGAAIDFGRREVRDFFIDNALMWLQEYRFDGLRFDAVHAIEDPTFLEEMAGCIRQEVPLPRQVWLMLENESNEAHRIQQGYDAQWNDDWHNTMHVLLTGEREAYYADFAERPTERLARCLSEGFVYQGERSRHGHTRGEPSGHLPPTAFVAFLQNHDQIGNRAFGERLTQLAPVPALRAATALLLLSPMIPLTFMGDEWGASEPFLFFTSHHGELADAVRKGRRDEFKDFAAFADSHKRERIPDPNAPSTFDASRPAFDALSLETDRGEDHRNWAALYRELLDIRHREIVPRLQHGAEALGADVLAEGAVSARWRLGDGDVLRIDLNLSEHSVKSPPHVPDRVLYQSFANAAELSRDGTLNPWTAIVSLSKG